jgi:hypothetical protein
VQVFMLVIGGAHWVGCAFFFLARLAGFDDSAFRMTWFEQWYANTNMTEPCENYVPVTVTYIIILFKVCGRSAPTLIKTSCRACSSYISIPAGAARCTF